MMLEIINVEQGTQEWYDMRAKYPRTASRTPIVLGLSPFSNNEKLAKEIKFGIKPYYSKAMQLGNELEDMVRERANAHFMDTFMPMVGVNGEMLASLDGINLQQDTLIEIKVSEHTFNEIKRGVISDHYLWQIKHQMQVFDSVETAYLIAYNKNTDEIAVSEPIIKDEQFGNDFFKIIGAWDLFESYMKYYELPEEIEREDKEWEALANELRELNAKKKELTAKEDECKAKLKEMAGGVKSQGCGVLVYPTVKSSTDYKKMIAENNIDADKYKKEATISWAVKVS